MDTIKYYFHQEDKYITSYLGRTLLQNIARDRALKFWDTHDKQVYHPFSDLSVLEHASNNTPIWQRRWLTKWSHGMCGVGKWLRRWGEQTHSKCPRCLTDNETVQHVICCPQEEASLLWSTGIQDIKKWIISSQGAPGLAEALTSRLMNWRNGTSITSPYNLDENLAVALEHQAIIGWDNFCFGVVSHKLRSLQHDHLQGLGRKSSGVVWMSKLLRKLWNLQHEMWVHRNKSIYKGTGSVHEYERQAVTQVVHYEFMIGRNRLGPTYLGLFQGSVHNLLKKDNTSLLLWLESVWLARDRLRDEEGLDPWDRDPVAATFVQRSKLRRKRKRTA